jgi:hypothetical protein
MENKCPIRPHGALLDQWCHDSKLGNWRDVAIKAAQWGADQELEACCEWLGDAPVVYNDNDDLHPGSYLRDARRPNAPRLKEEALLIIDTAVNDYRMSSDAASVIRRALEQLNY